MKNGKKTARTVIDAAMLALLPVLMAYSLVGETLHEIAGTAMFILFIAHHIINRRSTAAMFRGKQNAVRLFGTVINILLFAIMLLLPLSGILMSKHLYTFLPSHDFSSTARTVHLLSSYWGFVLMGVHFGLHADRWLGGIKHKPVLISLAVLFTLISAYGVHAFISRQLPEYMFLKTSFVFFNFAEPRIFFFLDYLSIMMLFAQIGFVIKKILNKINKIGGKQNG